MLERGRALDGVMPPLVRVGLFGGYPPRKFSNLTLRSVEAILMHFETIFACEIRLIVQAVHVFKCL